MDYMRCVYVVALIRVTFEWWNNSKYSGLQWPVAHAWIRKYQNIGECSLWDLLWKMIVFKAFYRCFLLLKWGRILIIYMEIRQHLCGYSSILFFLQYNSISNLCHFSMTPLCTITQHINDEPYTTPAERGLKIKARAYCRNVISGRGLFRLSLNIALQIADSSIWI